MVRQDLLFLESKQEYPSVSLILPFKLTMPDRLENKTRVNNAIKLAKKQLEEKHCSAADIDAVMQSIEKIIYELDYETVSAESVAIFANKNISKIYYLPVPVPNEQIVVSDRFILQDILYALQQLPTYWVLVVSEKPSRLFYGVLRSLTEIIEPAQNAQGIDVDGFPYNYMPPDVTAEEMYRGLDCKADRYFDGKKEKFFDRVFKLAKRFLDVQHIPLFITATEKDHTLFERAANGYTIAGWLRGNYCKLRAEELSPLIWPIVEDYLTQERQKKLIYFEEVARGTDSKHAEGFQAVMAAAKEGRVHELLIELTIEDVSPVKVNELIDTVLNKGNGRVIFYQKDDLKKYGQVAAVLRY